MDKSRVCVNKSIDLVKKKCPKKTNLLVYDRSGCVKPKTPAYTVPNISALPAKRIKVCTGAELKKICPPKLCDCPPYQPGISFIRAIVHMIGLVAKSLLAGGLVYLTYRSGMWGDNEQTEKLFLGLCKDLAPTLCGKNKTVKLSELCESEINLMCVPSPPAPPCCEKMPVDHERSGYALAKYWNCAVTCVIGAIANFPNNVYETLDNWQRQMEKNKKKKKEC